MIKKDAKPMRCEPSGAGPDRAWKMIDRLRALAVFLDRFLIIKRCQKANPPNQSKRSQIYSRPVLGEMYLIKNSSTSRPAKLEMIVLLIIIVYVDFFRFRFVFLPSFSIQPTIRMRVMTFSIHCEHATAKSRRLVS